MVDALAIGAILEQVASGDLSIDEAARRLGWIETGEPTTCASCIFLIQGACYRPGQPPRDESPNSIKCGTYQYNDPKLTTPNDTVKRNSFMFK